MRRGNGGQGDGGSVLKAAARQGPRAEARDYKDMRHARGGVSSVWVEASLYHGTEIHPPALLVA